MVKNHSIAAVIGDPTSAWAQEGGAVVADSILGRGPVARFDHESHWSQALLLTPGSPAQTTTTTTTK